MKHNRKVTAIVLALFLLTQLIGLYVVNSYSPQKIVNGKVVNQTAKVIPYGMGFQENNTQKLDAVSVLFSFLFSLVIAISLILLLIKIKARFVLRIWFLLVIILALGISFTSFLPSIKYASWIGLIIAIPLAFLKIYKRNFIIHNITEIFIYPGIAAIFVPILGIISIIALLVIISIYDMWAVWKSKIMQKMAKYQINKLNIFGGLFIPYGSKKTRDKIKKIKLEGKKTKGSKIKVEIALLGGGDIVFPIIASGVVLINWGLIPALITTLGALLGISGLLIFGNKKRMYPAMPFISSGILLALLVNWIFLVH